MCVRLEDKLHSNYFIEHNGDDEPYEEGHYFTS